MKAAGLCTSSATLFDLCESQDVLHVTDADVESELERLTNPNNKKWQGGQNSHVLAVGPIILSTIMRLSPPLQRKFMTLATSAASVVFYRYSASCVHAVYTCLWGFRLNPYQKSEILDLKRKFFSGVSVAIGDGGNDAQVKHCPPPH